jgi:hypothetical protein
MQDPYAESSQKFVGVRGAYKMLGKEEENKNCLVGWVWVHPQTAASSQTGALVIASSLRPL